MLLGKVVLMLFFCLVERHGWFYLTVQVTIGLGGGKFVEKGIGLLVLGLRCCEYRGPVSHDFRFPRIIIVRPHLQNFFVRNLFRIEFNHQGFRMVRQMIKAQCTLRCSSGVASCNSLYAIHLFETWQKRSVDVRERDRQSDSQAHLQNIECGSTPFSYLLKSGLRCPERAACHNSNLVTFLFRLQWQQRTSLAVVMICLSLYLPRAIIDPQLRLSKKSSKDAHLLFLLIPKKGSSTVRNYAEWTLFFATFVFFVRNGSNASPMQSFLWRRGNQGITAYAKSATEVQIVRIFWLIQFAEKLKTLRQTHEPVNMRLRQGVHVPVICNCCNTLYTLLNNLFKWNLNWS